MKKSHVCAAVVAMGAIGVSAVAMASPGWAASEPADTSVQACGLAAWGPTVDSNGIHGRAGRGGCASGDTVNYLWARVYRDVNNWPDALRGEAAKKYVTNGYVDVTGACGPHASYYVQASDSRGNAVETPHVFVC